MKTKEFLALLKEHENKSLIFEYKKGHLVGANYHITEIKNITVDSVDCGTGTDLWRETLIQLWEDPNEKGKDEYMIAQKALQILDKVDSIRTMERNAEVKFEYSNINFHTAQLFVTDFKIMNKQLILKLNTKPTDCKAKDACGIAIKVETTNESVCTPGSGCC